MEQGKEVCKMLRQVRKQIADANGIEFNPTECQHKGYCSGTCPKCESEVRYIENQLTLMQKAGKAIKIIGLAAGVTCAVSASLSACSNRMDGDCPEPPDIQRFRWEKDSRVEDGLIPSEGGSFQFTCTNTKPVIGKILLHNSQEYVDCKICELDSYGKPWKIVDEYYVKNITVCPIKSDDLHIDAKDVIYDWISFEMTVDGQMTINVQPNEGDDSRKLEVVFFDQGSSSRFSSLYFTQNPLPKQ